MKLVFDSISVAPITLALLFASYAIGQDTQNLTIAPADTAVQIAAGSLVYRGLDVLGSGKTAPAARPQEDDIPSIPAPGFYPSDMQNPKNRPTIVTTQHHPVYVNMPPSHWGDVGTFLSDLGRSNFIHVVDQYVGTSANNRYTLGTSFTLKGSLPHVVTAAQFLGIVHAAAAIKGGGLGHMYHIFLPKGTDVCLSPTDCYSPDVPANFNFCAFHGAVTFADAVGHVIFSIEPYQNVDGCSVPPTGTGSGQLNDSTANVLSHEVFESITDPNLDAWWVHDLVLTTFGNEIGDLCARAGFFGKNVYWNYGNVRLNGHLYTVQPEYSNAVHGCTYRPTDGGEDN